MGRTAVDMGDLTNQDMYDAVFKALSELCPSMNPHGLPWQFCKSGAEFVPTHHEHLGNTVDCESADIVHSVEVC
jgi:hypothetical protein